MIFVWLSSVAAYCGETDARRVVVEAGERFTAKKEMRKTLTSPKGEIRYLAEHTATANGTLPPPWLLKWVTANLRSHGHLPADTSRARLWLVFEWGPIDPAISHFGRPAQNVDVRGRKIIEHIAGIRDRAETTPFCTIIAYDIADVLKPVTERRQLWRAKMWPIFIAAHLNPKVEVGPLVFREYVDADPNAERSR